MNPAARLPFIDALKGLAILGVLFAHMGFTERFDEAALAHIRVLQSLTGWCVLAFFFASGFLHGHADAQRDWKSFARRRAARLLIPCAAFTWLNKLLLLAAKACGFAGTVAAPPLATAADIAAFVFVPASPQFYFLVHLFLIALAVHALLRARLLSLPLEPWFLAALLVQAYWFLPLTGPHGESPAKLPLYAAVYLTGLAFARARDARRMPLAIGMMIFAVSAVIAAAAQHAVLHALVPLAFALLAPFVHARILSPAAALGRKSGAVFAWHAPLVMSALSVTLVKFRLAGWPLIAAMTALAIIVSLVIASFVRPLDRRGVFRL